MNAVVRKAYFSVEGEWLANFARTRVMEGAWEAALKMLVDDVSCTHEQAIEILKGHATFTGVSEIGNPDDPGLGWKELPPNGKIAKAMQRQLDYLYSTVFKHGEKYWKPYAYVQGWDIEDMRFSHTYVGVRNIIGLDRKRYGLRSLFYANDPRRDLLIFIDENPEKISDVLCEETKVPPLWYDVPINRPIEHLLALREAGKLDIDRRGALFNSDLALDDRFEEPEVDETPETPADAPVKVRPDPAELTKQFLAELEKTTSISEIQALERKYEGADGEAYDKSHALIEKLTGDRIREQADKLGGWMELNLRTEETPNFDPPFIRVPKNPFLRWALRSFSFEDYGKVVPEWPCITGSGWKLPMDDPFHTDWMLGAGISLSDAYRHEYDYTSEDKNQKITLGEAAMRAAWDAKSQIVKEWTGVPFSILAKGDDWWVGGTVVHPKPNEAVPPGSVAIVPHAGPAYQLAMETACKQGETGRPGLLICEIGGKLAHLAVVGRERKCTVLMVPGALKKYPAGSTLFIDLNTDKIALTIL